MMPTLLADVAEAVIVRPGDTLLLRVPTGTPYETAQRLRSALRSRLCDEVVVLVIACDQLAVMRPDEVAVRDEEVRHGRDG